jgi:hypothetical protein
MTTPRAEDRRHHRQHASAAGLRRRREGRGVGDLDPTHILVRHLGAPFADSERRQRDIDIPGVCRQFGFELVHVHDHLLRLRVRELRDVATSDDDHLSAQRTLQE